MLLKDSPRFLLLYFFVTDNSFIIDDKKSVCTMIMMILKLHENREIINHSLITIKTSFKQQLSSYFKLSFILRNFSLTPNN